MKLYCLDILAVGMVILGIGGITIGKATENKVDVHEQEIIQAGYQKTNLTYNQILYADFEECLEYKNKFYCY